MASAAIRDMKKMIGRDGIVYWILRGGLPMEIFRRNSAPMMINSEGITMLVPKGRASADSIVLHPKPKEAHENFSE